MNMKKILCRCIASLIFFTSITGCDVATGSAVEQTNTELKVLIDGITNDQLNGVVEKFKDKLPEIKITICNNEYYGVDNQTVKWNDVVPKIEAEIMAGSGPDIFLVGTWGLFGELSKTIKSGVFYDINRVLEKSNAYDKNDYLAPAIKAGQYKGGQYVFPVYINTPLLVSTKENIIETGINLGNCKDYFGLMNELAGYHNRSGTNNMRSSIMPHLRSNLNLMNAYDNEVIFNSNPINAALSTYKECEKNSSLYGSYMALEGNFSMFVANRIIFSDEYWGFNALDLASQLNEKFEPIFLPKYNSKGQIQTEIDCGLAVNASSPNIANVEKFFNIMLTNDDPINVLDDKVYLELHGVKDKYSNVPLEERYRFEGVKNVLPVKKSVFMRSLKCKQKKLNDGYIYNSYIEVDANQAIKIKPLDESYYKQFEDMYNNIEVCTLPSRKVNNLVYSYFEPYFTDQKTLEECIQTAQSAMEIYISE